MTMILRPATSPPDVAGRLCFAAMPGRFEPWARFLEEARRADLALVLCLAPLALQAVRAAGGNPQTAEQSGPVDEF